MGGVGHCSRLRTCWGLGLKGLSWCAGFPFFAISRHMSKHPAFPASWPSSSPVATLVPCVVLLCACSCSSCLWSWTRAHVIELDPMRIQPKNPESDIRISTSTGSVEGGLARSKLRRQFINNVFGQVDSMQGMVIFKKGLIRGVLPEHILLQGVLSSHPFLSQSPKPLIIYCRVPSPLELSSDLQ